MNAAASAPSPGLGVDAALVATLLAIDPVGLGGVALRMPACEQRTAWLEQLRMLLPAPAPMRRIPLHIADDRLLGGLDLTATLTSGKRVVSHGVLAGAHGGIAVVAMAERVDAATAAKLAAVQDLGAVVLERDGIASRLPARLALVLLDEGLDDNERVPEVLRERVAFWLDLRALRPHEVPESLFNASQVELARERLASVSVGDEVLSALVGTAAALGISSARASWFALRAALAIAALDGAASVTPDHAINAARLVLAARATQLPATGEPEPPPADDESAPPRESEQQSPSDPPPGRDESPPQETAEPPDPQQAQPLEDRVLEATRAAIPAGLLALLMQQLGRSSGRSSGRVGAQSSGAKRGRPLGSRPGQPRNGARLDLLDTLRAAAPWQRVRRRVQDRGRLQIETQDLKIRRFKQRAETLTVFVVDASGSSALHRLAEAKGAVELLLADCYVRRDQVAVVAFRGAGAEVLLPPTRSLVRAKRSLAGLPGGGGTPLAHGLDAALELARGMHRRGITPTLVVLSDGRGNIARDGKPGRAQAEIDALDAARRVRAAGFASLFLDTSPRAHPAAATLALAMQARYLPLPHADAAAMNRAVRDTQRKGGGA